MRFGVDANKGEFGDADSASAAPFAVLESLEPRILLSADGLLSISPDPLDSLLDTTPLIVQHAEILQAEEQSEQQDQSELSEDNIYEPVLTLSLDQTEDQDQTVDNAEVNM